MRKTNTFVSILVMTACAVSAGAATDRTFVTGPHVTKEDCLSKIAELNPPPAKKKF